ncbi:MAG: hypothetical protein ACYCRH_08150 [Acidiferrobacteraceae bacterium]
MGFGCRDRSTDFSASLLAPLVNLTPLHVIRCFSHETGPLGCGEFPGWVTEAIANTAIDWTQPELYVCGNPTMVQTLADFARAQGCDHIYREYY